MRWIIMRHAHTQSDGPTDKERRLAERGRDEARAMGVWLRDQGWVPDRVLCSPAIRARQTAQTVLQAAGADPEVAVIDALYQGGPAEYVGALQRSDAPCTLLVGHIPAVEDVVLHLAADAPRTPTGRLMPTAAAACFEDGRLVVLQRPDALELHERR